MGADEGWWRRPRPVVPEAEGLGAGLLVAALAIATAGVVRGHPVAVAVGVVLALPYGALQLAFRPAPGDRALAAHDGRRAESARTARLRTVLSTLVFLVLVVLLLATTDSDSSFGWWWGTTLTLGNGWSSLVHARRWARYEQAAGGQVLRRPWTWQGWAGTKGWTWRSAG